MTDIWYPKKRVEKVEGCLGFGLPLGSRVSADHKRISVHNGDRLCFLKANKDGTLSTNYTDWTKKREDAWIYEGIMCETYT